MGIAEDGLDWVTGGPGPVPFSRRYNDPFYAPADGFAETRHVYLDGNELPRRWSEGGMGAGEGFRTGELGFGAGLATLAAWSLWRQLAVPGAVLEHVSFEEAPLDRAALARALGPFPSLRLEAAELLGAWPDSPPVDGTIGLDLGDLRLEVRVGDARVRVPSFALDNRPVDAWFLDGFAPSRNPEMWEPPLLAAVARATRPGGTAASYTAAGAVRRALRAAGFVVKKRAGFGSKREMVTARLQDGRGATDGASA
ncbi:MAG: tRNA (5-methylaminomethyl-2-thiouridine)(34)-methyltransferase MnmD [Pseudomonadota bacterium]